MPFRLPRWWPYTLIFALFASVIVREFRDARRLQRPATNGALELVDTRRPVFATDKLEVRVFDQVRIQIEGLAPIESSPKDSMWWRHGFRPTTRLILSPNAKPLVLRWDFGNQVADQALTVRCNGATLTQELVPLGRSTGQAIIPPSQSASTVELVFARHISFGGESPAITVTFTSLTIRNL